MCPLEFHYQFGTCSKIFQGSNNDDNEANCKERTMGTGKPFVLPHVSIHQDRIIHRRDTIVFFEL